MKKSNLSKVIQDDDFESWVFLTFFQSTSIFLIINNIIMLSCYPIIVELYNYIIIELHNKIIV